ncbi:protein ENDOSPERM DEFECTIVE 1 [Cornus florida]|uniref:protein ENDOSPERM DEFECTIVE 1 n=1 Tax=Cornus florida TaxID=4283 RepID=UPI0028982035|nr:protein ENDOSPERM DEFECTIVE 1 [Cornus florida]
MNEPTVEVPPQPPAAADTTALAAPPLPHRRPRVREVSSRFMSPSVSSSHSSSSGDPHLVPARSPHSKHVASTPNPTELQGRRHQQRSKSVQRSRQEADPLSRADENIPETIRSLETPLGLHSKGLVSVQRKPSASVKLFKENGGGRAEQSHSSDFSQSKGLVSGKCSLRSGNLIPSRPDTPTVTGGDRVIQSRFRLQRPANSGGGTPAVTAAAKLLQSSGLSLSAQPSNWDSSQEANSNSVNTSSGDDDKVVSQSHATIPLSNDSNSCNGSPVQNCKTRALPDVRCSMPEVDMLPTVSTRLLADRGCSSGNVNGSDTSKFTVSPCSRSLNCEQSSLFYSLKTNEKSTSMTYKPCSNSVKMGSLCLPPVPPCMKLGADAKKGRKGFSNQEEIHYLKLLHNRYMQWRYANAKAEVSLHAQRREAERKLYSLAVKISDLRNTVEGKRIELGMLQRAKTLFTILEAHMPYLDEWFALEEEFSTSLSGASDALLNASLQLPVSGNVQVDIREVGEALHSAAKVMETIGLHVQIFMLKAEELDNLITEVARVSGGERALVEECGDLLFKTNKSQVEECSLRGHLIQLQRSNHGQPQEG